MAQGIRSLLSHKDNLHQTDSYDPSNAVARMNEWRKDSFPQQRLILSTEEKQPDE